ncbi:hypothetical protein NL676_023950 [Syzygium grande]|nr:hypothetical protein NL676_023950 [Syzygium grande]
MLTVAPTGSVCLAFTTGIAPGHHSNIGRHSIFVGRLDCWLLTHPHHRRGDRRPTGTIQASTRGWPSPSASPP